MKHDSTPPASVAAGTPLSPTAVAGDGERSDETAQHSLPRESAIHRALTPEPAPAMESPAPEILLSALSALTQRVSANMDVTEVLGCFVDTLHGLFPNRRLLLYFLGPNRPEEEGAEVQLVYKSMGLRPGREDRLELPASAHSGELPALIRPVERFQPFFSEGACGFSLPVMMAERVRGVLTVEYPGGRGNVHADRAAASHLLQQISPFLQQAHAQQTTRYLHNYLDALLQHSSAPIAVIGADQRVEVANQAFLSLSGLERRHFIGRDFADLIPESERQRLVPVFFRALRGEPTHNIDLKIPRRDGTFARLLLDTVSVTGSDGRVESVIAIGQDLVKVRELEEQVIQAEKLATLGQLAAGVVHELNNPLTSISVYSDFLLKKAKERSDDAKDIEKFERIVGGAERILRFTRDLVAYARPNCEQPRPVEIDQVLDQSLVFCEHLIQETGIKVVRQYEKALPEFYATKTQLHQVFINLITNACHAMPVGAGVLQLHLEQDEAGAILIRLVDNGCGIPPGQLDHVFEPFFSTKGEGKGTGLGLSIVRNIVQQLGGDISVESVVGQGTTFELRFLGR